MKEMFERVIALKNYDLKTLLAHIDQYHIRDRIHPRLPFAGEGREGYGRKDSAGAAPAAGLLPAEVRRGRQLWRRNALCPEGLPEQGGHQGGRHLRHGDPCRADGGNR